MPLVEGSLKKGLDFVGISVVLFCYANGKFLMARRGNNSRDEHGKWDIGAGGIEWGDSAEQTLRNEVMKRDVWKLSALNF